MADEIGPGPAGVAPGGESGIAIVENAEVIARLYRRLVILVGIQLASGLIVQALAIARFPGAVLVALVADVLVLGTLVALPVTAYQLTAQMKEGTRSPILWAVLMLLPCVNIISLLILSSRAQAWCRRYGIKVGFFGPTRESIEDLRRRILTSHFE